MWNWTIQTKKRHGYQADFNTGAGSWGLHNQTCFSHSHAYVWQCEPRVQLSLSQALSLHRLSQIAPLKNITFQYKKLHYKLLYRKFNTLKKMPPWKTASEFQVCTGERGSTANSQGSTHTGSACCSVEVGPPSQIDFLRLVTEVHKYIAAFLFTVPSHLFSWFWLVCWTKRKLF